MSALSPILGLIDRHGERCWFRNISRDVNASTGSPREAYADNKSCTVRIVEMTRTERGINIFLPSGKAVGWAKPSELWNDSMQVKVNDQIIRLPNNYSAGNSIIYRVDGAKRINLINQSQHYIRLNLTETAAKE